MSGTLKVNLSELRASIAAEYKRLEKRPVPTAPWVMPLDLEDLLAFIEAARSLHATGWNDADGKCWCLRAVEETGSPHIGRCLRARAALNAFDFTTDDSEASSPDPDSQRSGAPGEPR